MSSNHPQSSNTMQGNLPEKKNGADAAKKLDWIDRMLRVVNAEERELEGEGKGEGDGERWTRRVFWDEWREQVRRKACREAASERGL